jgi:hypothetical protein
MFHLQKIKKNFIRISLFFVISFFIFEGYHTLFLITTFGAIFLYPRYYEALFFGLLFDVFFSLNNSTLWGIPFFYSLIFFIPLVSVSFIRSFLLRP